MLSGLGGGAWGAGPALPVTPIGAGPSSASLPPAPQPANSTAQAAPRPTLPVAPTSPVRATAAAAPAPASGGPWIAKCKGLPFSATVEKVEKFFDELVRSTRARLALTAAAVMAFLLP